MSTIIEFLARQAPAGPDDWLRHVFRDVLFAIIKAKDLQQAREIAAEALTDMEGDAA
jgi:hypothetical protein